MILDPGFNLTLRPMKYPEFFELYKSALKNTWSVDEVKFSPDINDLARMTPSERHLISRLVAFFATGDAIVGNNLVLNLYKHINSPEARLYLSRQLFEEALHVQFYLTLLDTYIPDHKEREKAFSAIDNIPSIKKKGDFCYKYMNSINELDTLKTKEDRRKFLMNLICFASCVEGLFFFGAFAYVFFLRSKGLLSGLGTGTQWVFRDESMHINFANQVILTARREEPDLFNSQMEDLVVKMLEDAIDCELNFAEDMIGQGIEGQGIAGLPIGDIKQYLQYVANQRLESLHIKPVFTARNPFDFLNLQDMQPLTNFFENPVTQYQNGIKGEVAFDETF
mgnify:CR=1 FL=1